MLTYSTFRSAGRRPTTSPASLQKKEYSSASTIQTKLTVGKPNDKYEQEADRVADQVVNSPTTTGPAVQKKCAACDKEDKAQMQPILQKKEEEEVQSKQIPSIMKMEEEEPQAKLQMMPEEEVQTKAADNNPQTVSSDVTSEIQSKKGGGSPMAESTRNFMETRIGADFSKVRIHNDSTAHKLSAKMNAQAFAVGNNVFFNQGKYNPESQTGKHLLAHELTHTVQQGKSEVRKQATPKKTKPKLSKTNVSGPTMGTCAKNAWKVKWNLSGANTATNGWIVQKINVNMDTKDCKNQVYAKATVNKTYWEAWQVRSGVVYSGNSTTTPGTDLFACKTSYNKTKGSLTFTGSADYYDGLSLPSDFKTNNKATFAGTLPATASDPGTLAGATGSIAHTYKVKWDCCVNPPYIFNDKTQLVYNT